MSKKDSENLPLVNGAEVEETTPAQGEFGVHETVARKAELLKMPKEIETLIDIEYQAGRAQRAWKLFSQANADCGIQGVTGKERVEAIAGWYTELTSAMEGLHSLLAKWKPTNTGLEDTIKKELELKRKTRLDAKFKPGASIVSGKDAAAGEKPENDNGKSGAPLASARHMNVPSR